MTNKIIGIFLFVIFISVLCFAVDKFSGRIFSFRETRNLNTEFDNVYKKINDLIRVVAVRGGTTSTYDISLNTTTATATVNTVTLDINGTTYTLLTT